MPCPPMNVCGEVRNNINWENSCMLRNKWASDVTTFSKDREYDYIDK